jgi:DNA repair protein RadA/Sms
LPHQLCFAGEVGLSGEIRAVNRIEQRIAEAEKLGFEKIIVSKYNQKGLARHKSTMPDKPVPTNPREARPAGIEVVTMGRVEEVYRYLFA